MTVNKIKILMKYFIFTFVMISLECKIIKNFLYVKCVYKAIERFQESNRNTWVYIIHQLRNDSSLQNFVSTIVSNNESEWSIVLADNILHSRNNTRRIKPSIYLIIASDYKHLKNILLNLNISRSSWNPNSKFILTIEEDKTENALIRKEIADILFYLDIYNFILLVAEQQTSKLSVINIYSSYFLIVTNICPYQNNLILISRCTSDDISKNLSMYSLKETKNFNGCVIRVCGFHWPPYAYAEKSEDGKVLFTNGYNILTLRMLAYKRNLQITYVSPEEGSRWGMLLDNGTWTGALGMLQSRQADIVIGGALQTPLRFSKFDCSPTYKSIFLKFYLPLPSKLPYWRNMIDIFSLAFWFTIAITYFITSICICLLSKFLGNVENDHFQNYTNCFFTLWRTSVGYSAYNTPKSQAVRVIFLLWLVYNFHVTLVYTSSLLSFITTPTYEQPMRSMEELSHTDLQLIVVRQFVQISYFMDEELKSVILRKFNPGTANHETDIERMMNKKDVTILDTADHFQIFAKERFSQIYALEDVIRLNPGIYLRKGSIYLKILNDIQFAILENGMLSKWEKDITESDKYKKYGFTSYNNKLFALTLQELSGSFYVLIFGLFVSFIVFIIEKIYFKLSHK